MSNEEFLRSISLDGEIWKDVVGWEDYYAVSNYGRVASIFTTIVCCNGMVKSRQPHLLSQFANNKGYLMVNFKRGGKHTSNLVHRLVAITFIPNPCNRPEIDHIDTNPKNNIVSNLRWCDRCENMRNPKTQQKMSQNAHKMYNQDNPKSRAVVGISITDKNDIVSFPSMREAMRNGYSENGIWRCCKKQQRSTGNRIWMYLSDYGTSHQ